MQNKCKHNREAEHCAKEGQCKLESLSDEEILQQVFSYADSLQKNGFIPIGWWIELARRLADTKAKLLLDKTPSILGAIPKEKRLELYRRAAESEEACGSTDEFALLKRHADRLRAKDKLAQERYVADLNESPETPSAHKDYVRPAEVTGISGYCVFCMSHKNENKESCSYGMHHEYWQDEVKQKPKQEKKPDKKLCKKCGLHPKNPASSTNGCDHEYPELE